MTDYLSRRIPSTIRCLWLLADGGWHDAREVATPARVAYQTAQTVLAAGRYFGLLETDGDEEGPRYRVQNWPRFEEAVASFRPYLDGSYTEALREARAVVRARLFVVATDADGGGES
jgi:hypothetical protein